MRHDTVPPSPMKRVLFILVSSAAVSACHAPQLSPTAEGCYAMQLDSLATAYPHPGVPQMPAMIALDTANRGQVHVPRGWLEADWPGERRVSLGLLRTNWQVVDGRVVEEVRPFTPWPADTITLSVKEGIRGLGAVLGAVSPTEWRGWAWMGRRYDSDDPSLLRMRLRRAECGSQPLALSR